LHYADVERLLAVLHRLVDHGNTVVVIEHNLDVLKTADWLIDLGPEGGDKGGYVIAEGSPDQLAANAGSSTGQFLKPVLARHGRKPEKAVAKSNGSVRPRRAVSPRNRVAVG
jgi:excinuclease ABC subunit A